MMLKLIGFCFVVWILFATGIAQTILLLVAGSLAMMATF
jgi:hypothetical protein